MLDELAAMANSGGRIALNSGLYDGFLFYVIIYSPEV